MDMYGRRIWVPIFNRIDREDIGYGRTNMNGYGYLIIHGAGRRFTMGVGFMILFTDGCGFRVTTGLPHGYPGAVEATIMDGRRSGQGSV